MQDNEDSNAGGKEEFPKFEDVLGKLEGIVGELEQGNLSLDRSLDLYERGIRAYRTCREMLSEAEGKVARLVETLQGEMREEPLDAPEAD